MFNRRQVDIFPPPGPGPEAIRSSRKSIRRSEAMRACTSALPPRAQPQSRHAETYLALLGSAQKAYAKLAARKTRPTPPTRT